PDLEERDQAARRARLVAEVQVVHVRRVEVDGLLHQPQPERARVEVERAGGVGGDRGDVVDPVQGHGSSSPSAGAGARAAARPAGTAGPADEAPAGGGAHASRARGRLGDPLTPPELGAWRGMLRAHAALTRRMDAELRARHGLSLTAYEALMLIA